METLTFKIKKREVLKINFSLEQMRKYPVHEHYMFKEIEYKVHYEYNPTKKIVKEDLIKFLKVELKKTHKATEVVLK